MTYICISQIHDVPSDPRGAGVCAFASRDVERGEVVVEYTGELITLEEAKVREERYAQEGIFSRLLTYTCRRSCSSGLLPKPEIRSEGLLLKTKPFGTFL